MHDLSGSRHEHDAADDCANPEANCRNAWSRRLAGTRRHGAKDSSEPGNAAPGTPRNRRRGTGDSPGPRETVGRTPHHRVWTGSGTV